MELPPCAARAPQEPSGGHASWPISPRISSSAQSCAGSLATLTLAADVIAPENLVAVTHGRLARLGAARHRPEGFAPKPRAVRGACDLLLVRAAVPLRAAAVDRRDVAPVARHAAVRALRPAYAVPPLRRPPRHLAFAHRRRSSCALRHRHRLLLCARPPGRRRLAGWRVPVHRLSDAPDPRRDLLGRRDGRPHQEVVRHGLQARRHALSGGSAGDGRRRRGAAVPHAVDQRRSSTASPRAACGRGCTQRLLPRTRWFGVIVERGRLAAAPAAPEAADDRLAARLRRRRSAGARRRRKRAISAARYAVIRRGGAARPAR